LNAEGTTILFTTHYLEEAEQLCESVTFINHGKVVKEGKLSKIQQEFSKNVIHFELFDRAQAALVGVNPVGSEYEFPITDLSDDMTKIIKHYGDNLKSIRNAAPSLETIFLDLTK
jgi:ABC-2 type transport system ATP-binding protein